MLDQKDEFVSNLKNNLVLKNETKKSIYFKKNYPDINFGFVTIVSLLNVMLFIIIDE